MAVGHLLGWRGDIILAEGDKFASSAGTYNTISPGPWVDTETLPPFVLSLDKLHVEFNEIARSLVRHAAALRRPDDVAERAGAPKSSENVSVNHPITVDGADIFLLGNGYTPVITVRDAKGAVLYREATPFLPQDPNYRSVGVIKVPSASPKQLGFTGFFLPTAEPTFTNGPVSLFPDANNPEIAMSLWEGNLFPGGAPQSVYTLNTEQMKQVLQPNGSPRCSASSPARPSSCPAAVARSPSTASSASPACRCAPTPVPRSVSSVPSSRPSASSSASPSSAAASSSACVRPRRARAPTPTPGAR